MSNNKKSEKKAGTKMRSSKNFKISTRIMLTAILGILIPIFLIGAFSPVLIYFTGSYFNISSVTTNYYSTINQIQWAQTISSISNALLSEGEDKEKLDGFGNSRAANIFKMQFCERDVLLKISHLIRYASS